MGFTAWLLVGVLLLLVGIVWLLSLTQTIVMPLMAASVVAAVCAPVVAWLARRGCLAVWPRYCCWSRSPRWPLAW